MPGVRLPALLPHAKGAISPPAPPCLEVLVRLSPCWPVECPQRALNLVGSAPLHHSGTKSAAAKASHRHLAVPDVSASYGRAPAPAPSQPAPCRRPQDQFPRHLGKAPLPCSSRAPGLPGRHLQSRTGTRHHQGRRFHGHPPPPRRIFAPSAHPDRGR